MTASANDEIRSRFYPEIHAGGFSHVDSTVEFYTRINALLNPEMVVLDFGAGRGLAAEDPVPSRRGLRTLRGKVHKVIGVDVDPIVRTNPNLDESAVIEPDARLPFADATFDLIVSDWTLEHIEDAPAISGELTRVLRPGGWICARTPNRWGYVALGGRLVPERLQAAVLRRLQPGRKECDVFPKVYKINTKRNVLKYFSNMKFDLYMYSVNSEPAYMGNSALLWWLTISAFHVTPGRFRAILHIFLRKK